jgi:hypothetical protein
MSTTYALLGGAGPGAVDITPDCASSRRSERALGGAQSVLLAVRYAAYGSVVIWAVRWSVRHDLYVLAQQA